MGNCIEIQKPVCWADDEIEDADAVEDYRETKSPTPPVSSKDDYPEKEAAVPASEIKIKLSKKQLEKLLRQASGGGVPLQQVLLNLVSLEETYRNNNNNNNNNHEYHVDREDGHWRPKLHSIPEIMAE